MVSSSPPRAVCDPRGITVIEDAASSGIHTKGNRWARARRSPPGPSIPARSSPPERGDDHHLPIGVGRSGPATPGTRDERVRRRRHASVLAPAGDLHRGRLRLRMTDCRPRSDRPARADCRGSWLGVVRLAAGYAKQWEIPGLRVVADPLGDTQLPVLLGGGRPQHASQGTRC